jgi:alkanesulfonate monooxygenase SsuD/methylene tetrahydromethanopterin reductase-like flavin-dependent oxidoreductase (luciferase family)
MVTNINLRHPAVLGKMATVVDQISKGRLIVGLGTGDAMSRSELTSYGYEFSGLKERVERLRETVQFLKATWSHDEDVTFKGKYYQIKEDSARLKPTQQPHPPIWVGGRHARILDVIAESADGWNYWDLSSLEAEEKTNYLRDRCAGIGRPFSSITVSWAGVLSRTDHTNKEAMLNLLRTKLRKDVSYLLVSFGPQATPENYEAFAHAAAQL